MIKIENLTKTFGPTIAVNNINFETQTGEILGFLGPNGAGKTTTTTIITCYMTPTAGNVRIGDLNVLEDSLEVRKKIGYLPETNPLYKEMGVYESLVFASEIRQIPKEKRNARIAEMIEICGLTSVINKYVDELSKGYRQRLGLAQAMIHDPEILILDEPTTGLDPNQIVEIRHLIKELGQKKTVIFSTHILSEAESTCDRVLIIDKGKIVADGTKETLQAQFQGLTTLYLQIKSTKDDVSEKLKQLEGVETMEMVESTNAETKRYILGVKKDLDIRESIFHKAVKEKWIILEMNQEKQTLENVFRALTT